MTLSTTFIMSSVTRFSGTPKPETISLVSKTSSHDDVIIKQKPWESKCLKGLFLDSWATEYIAMAAAVVTFAGITLILGLYGGLPLRQWPYSIQINTVLSTLAIVMKAFMLVSVGACLGQLKWLWYTHRYNSLEDFQVFDTASRGPWGAIRLLLRLKFWHLASIGSIVTLLSLASDAFIQQSVSYPLRNIAQNATIPSIPYAQSFVQYEDLPHGTPYMPEPLLAGIYDGVFSENLTHSASSITTQCPTGNCTFPPYASLAVCSRCNNVTSLLNYTYDANVEDGMTLGATYNYALPNGLSLFSSESSVAYVNITGAMWPNSDTLDAFQSSGTISNISVITGSPNATAVVVSPVALDCVLFLCAKSYNSGDYLGTFNETVTDVFDQPEWTFQGNTNLSAETYAFTIPSTHLPSIVNQDRTFQVNPLMITPVQAAFRNTLQGLASQGDNGQMVFTTDIAQGIYFMIANNVSMASIIDNIATALSNRIRTVSSHQMAGTAFALEVYIQVQWLWLLWPALMMLLAIIFLLLTVCQSNSSDVPYWRSSALAVMQHGVSTDALEEIGSNISRSRSSAMITAAGKETVSDLEDWAEGVKVRLRRRGPSGKGFGLTIA